LNKPLNKSQCTLIHVRDRRRDERVRIQMSTKWQERQTVKLRWVTPGQKVSPVDHGGQRQ